MRDANIREAPASSSKRKSTSFDRVFQRPVNGQGPRVQSHDPSFGHQASSSAVQPALDTAAKAPAVTLTLIIDPTLGSAKGSSGNVMHNIGLGVLNLMRALDPSDTISIFG